jgi:Flp pilus assembly protein TadD
MLRQELANGRSPALLHMVLGADAQDRDQKAEALLHFEQAHALAPERPDIANNLACSLMLAEPPDLSRALKLINEVLEKHSRNPHYRESRGQILARMQRWKEALVDMEYALPAMSRNRDLHRTLADIYTHLQVPRLAAEHRQLAELLPKR